MSSIMELLQNISQSEIELPTKKEYKDTCLNHGLEKPCQQCATDKSRGYKAATLADRCANGAERDHGKLYHAVPLASWAAVCGAKPGRRSAGWSEYSEHGQEITCPKCQKKLRNSATITT